MDPVILAVAIGLAVLGGLLHIFTPPKEEGLKEIAGKVVAAVVVVVLYAPVLLAQLTEQMDLAAAVVLIAPGVVSTAYYAQELINTFLDKYKPRG